MKVHLRFHEVFCGVCVRGEEKRGERLAALHNRLTLLAM